MFNSIPACSHHVRSFRRGALAVALASAVTLMAGCGGSSDDDSGGGGTPNFTVSTNAGDGGSISPGSASVTQGSTTTFSVTPLASHNLDSVTGCGGTLTGNTYTTAAITAACTVTAMFSLKTYTVTASAGSGGSISPGSATVDHGETAEFNVSADTGFEIDAVTGCGGSLAGDVYTTGAVTADCSIEASFAEADAAAPSGVSAAAGDGQVTVSWSPVEGATAYTLYWSSTPDIHPHTSASFDGFAEDVASPYTVTDLTNGTTYYFVVTAMFDAVEGDASTEVSATPTEVTGSGLVRTATHLIDVDAGHARFIHLLQAPSAFAFRGDEMFAFTTGSSRLWRFDQATGELENVMDAGPSFTVLSQLLSAAPDGELIRLAAPSENEGTFIALNPETKTSREFSNPDLPIVVDTDFTVAGNGNIVAKGGNTVVVMDRDGNTLAQANVEGLSALARTPDGGVVGISGPVSGQGNTPTTIVEIDTSTAAVTVLGAVPALESGGGSLQRVRLAASNDGYFVSEARTSNPGSIFFVDGTSFEVTELAMPDGVEILLTSTALNVGPDGHLYARLRDRRTSSPISLVMRFTLAGDEPEIKLAGTNPHIRYSAVGPNGDLFNYASGLLSTGRILRQDRRTGGLSLVAQDAALVNGYNLTVDGDSVYVISQRPGGLFLVHVDIPSGEVTELSDLGVPPTGETSWFVNTLASDPLSDDLFMGSTGGLGAVSRLATTPGSVPQIIASQFDNVAPIDMKVRANGDVLVLNSNGIWIVNPSTGATSMIVEHAAEIQSAQAFVELDDGRFVVFDAGDAEGQTLWRVDPATGQAEDFLVDPPSAASGDFVSFGGWAHLFRIP